MPTTAGIGTQAVTITGAETTELQVVVVQALPAAAAAPAHVATGLGPVFSTPGQVVVVQLLSAVGPLGVHDEAPSVPLSLTGQVVVVQPLPALAADGVHEATGTLVVLLVLQLVVV